MNFLRKTFASLIITITIPFVVMIALLMGLMDSYLNPDFYQTEHFEETIYEQIISTVSNQVLEQNKLLAEFVDEPTLTKNFKKVITPERIQTSIDNIFNQIASNETMDSITLELSDIKKEIPSILDQILEEINLETDIPLKTTDGIGDYIPSEINIPLDLIPQEELNILKMFITGQKELKKTFFTIGITLLFVIGLLIWKPLSTAILWVAGTTALWAFSIITMTQTLMQGLMNAEWSGINIQKIGEILKPLTESTYFYGKAIGIISIILFLSHFGFKHLEQETKKSKPSIHSKK
jgi:hypothetical protein